MIDCEIAATLVVLAGGAAGLMGALQVREALEDARELMLDEQTGATPGSLRRFAWRLAEHLGNLVRDARDQLEIVFGGRIRHPLALLPVLEG